MCVGPWIGRVTEVFEAYEISLDQGFRFSTKEVRFIYDAATNVHAETNLDVIVPGRRVRVGQKVRFPGRANMPGAQVEIYQVDWRSSQRSCSIISQVWDSYEGHCSHVRG